MPADAPAPPDDGELPWKLNEAERNMLITRAAFRLAETEWENSLKSLIALAERDGPATTTEIVLALGRFARAELTRREEGGNFGRSMSG